MRYAMGIRLYDLRVSRALWRSGSPTPPAPSTVSRMGGARGAGARDGMKWLDARLCPRWRIGSMAASAAWRAASVPLHPTGERGRPGVGRSRPAAVGIRDKCKPYMT